MAPIAHILLLQALLLCLSSYSTYLLLSLSLHLHPLPFLPEATRQKPPTIVNEPDNVQTMIFRPINLTCEAVGEPNPTYSWYRDGLFLVNTTKRELLIAQARPEDRGEYTCVAHNVHGSSNASSPALVTISGLTIVVSYLFAFIQSSPCTL